jgi:hypothetical protein
MLKNNAFADTVFSRGNIRDIFSNIIYHYAGVEETEVTNHRINAIWNAVSNSLNAQPYFNLDFCLKSLNMLPRTIRVQTSVFPAVVLSFLIQRHGVKYRCNARYFFTHNLAFPAPLINMMENLSAVRFNLQFPSTPPENIIYDLNWMKMAFPYEEFALNQDETVYKQHPKAKFDDVYLKRNTLWRFLRARHRIFYYSFVGEMKALEDIAFENMTQYALDAGLGTQIDLNFANQICLNKQTVII